MWHRGPLNLALALNLALRITAHPPDIVQALLGGQLLLVKADLQPLVALAQQLPPPIELGRARGEGRQQEGGGGVARGSRGGQVGGAAGRERGLPAAALAAHQHPHLRPLSFQQTGSRVGHAGLGGNRD